MTGPQPRWVMEARLVEPHIPLHIDDPVALLDAAMRRDFRVFLAKAVNELTGWPVVWNWHLDALVSVLEDVEAGRCKRLLVTMPPRHLKSLTISVAWVAWRLGRDPRLRFLCVSYAGELSDKSARDCKKLMQCDWYKRVFPLTRLSARTATHDFETTAGGGRFATSITGTVTGRGGGIIIIDDPIKPEDAFSDVVRNNVNDAYRSTLSTRLDDRLTGAMICVMQRLHQNDLAGVMLEEGGWDHLNLPAIAIEDQDIRLTRGRLFHRPQGNVLHPERQPLTELTETANRMGSVLFSAQYQQQPVPAQGNLVQSDWLRHGDLVTPDGGGMVVQSWDTASEEGLQNDYSVCLTAILRQGRLHLIDVTRAKLDFPKLKREVIRLAREFRATVLLFENAASGIQLYQIFRSEQWPGVPHPIKRTPKGDKKTRLAGVSPMIEAGQLILPREAHWLADFEHELLAFPNARHDDQVDALSQLLDWARSHASSDTIGPPPEIPPVCDIPGGDDSDDDWDEEDEEGY